MAEVTETFPTIPDHVPCLERQRMVREKEPPHGYTVGHCWHGEPATLTVGDLDRWVLDETCCWCGAVRSRYLVMPDLADMRPHGRYRNPHRPFDNDVLTVQLVRNEGIG